MLIKYGLLHDTYKPWSTSKTTSCWSRGTSVRCAPTSTSGKFWIPGRTRQNQLTTWWRLLTSIHICTNRNNQTTLVRRVTLRPPVVFLSSMLTSVSRRGNSRQTCAESQHAAADRRRPTEVKSGQSWV